MRALIAALVGAAALFVVPAQSQQVVTASHNGSVMQLFFGPVSEDVASLKIVYLKPKPAMMSEGVSPGTLLVEGGVEYDSGPSAGGTARIFKLGCQPLEYKVSGSMSSDEKVLKLASEKGLIPTFQPGRFNCKPGGFVTDREPLVFVIH